MSALLEERGNRQRRPEDVPGSVSKVGGQKSLDVLVESVKRKSRVVGDDRVGKRRKLAPK